MTRNTRPAEDTPEELTWLRGFEAGVIQMRVDAAKMQAEIERLRTAITDAAEAVEYGHERVKVASILRAAYTKMEPENE